MRSGARHRVVISAIVVAVFVGACDKRNEAEMDADAETKRAWQQPSAPAQAEQLRERLIMGQADH